MLFKGSVHWTVPASSRKLSPVDYKLYKLEELGGGGVLRFGLVGVVFPEARKADRNICSNLEYWTQCIGLISDQKQVPSSACCL